MDLDQTARMRRLVWIHAGRKRTMLVLSGRGSNVKFQAYDHILMLQLNSISVEE
jgi:hypothetical protein